jgi:hypothetical protein
MNVRKNFVAVLFGPERRAGELVAPGDADCRWRVAARLGRAAAVNDEAAVPEPRAPAAADPDGVSRRD